MRLIVRLILILFASNRWPCNVIDIKLAFLLVKQIDRHVFLIPSVEFQKQNMVWELKTCVYGLSDASSKWNYVN